MQVLFVPLEYKDLVLEIPHATQAAVYSQWVRERREGAGRNLSSNVFLSAAAKNYNYVMANHKACFDHELYIMVRTPTPVQSWNEKRQIVLGQAVHNAAWCCRARLSSSRATLRMTRTSTSKPRATEKGGRTPSCVECL